MSLPGELWRDELYSGPIEDPLGSHLAGRHDWPETQGEFQPGVADLARMAVSLAQEHGQRTGRQIAPEFFLVLSDPMHAAALKEVHRQEAELRQQQAAMPYLKVPGFIGATATGSA